MGVQSIRTAVQVGDVTGDRFLGLAVQVSFRKMDRVTELHDLAQEIGTMAETLQDARHLLPSRLGTPFVVNLRDLARRMRVLDEVDLPLDLLLKHRLFRYCQSSPRVVGDCWQSDITPSARLTESPVQWISQSDNADTQQRFSRIAQQDHRRDSNATCDKQDRRDWEP